MTSQQMHTLTIGQITNSRERRSDIVTLRLRLLLSCSR